MPTEVMIASQKLLNRKFKWTSDGNIDSWRILDLSHDVVLGDCDDYALTMAYLLSGSGWKLVWDILLFRHVFWMVESSRSGIWHIVLKHNGLYIDNIANTWSDTTPHKKLFPMPFPAVGLKWLMGKVLK